MNWNRLDTKSTHCFNQTNTTSNHVVRITSNIYSEMTIMKLCSIFIGVAAFRVFWIKIRADKKCMLKWERWERSQSFLQRFFRFNNEGGCFNVYKSWFSLSQNGYKNTYDRLPDFFNHSIFNAINCYIWPVNLCIQNRRKASWIKYKRMWEHVWIKFRDWRMRIF